jgi:hypothetical protein
MTDERTALLYGKPGDETLSTTMADFLSHHDPADYGPDLIVEVHDVTPQRDHLPNVAWVLEAISEWVPDHAMTDEGWWEALEDAMNAETVTDACHRLLDAIAAAHPYFMAKDRLGIHHLIAAAPDAPYLVGPFIPDDGDATGEAPHGDGNHSHDPMVPLGAILDQMEPGGFVPDPEDAASPGSKGPGA